MAKHSLYLISHSELPGFSQNEMLMVANVDRYHRNAHPQPRHHTFVSHTAEERVRVTRLASILRIADSLDREHTQRVTGVTTKISDDEVSLRFLGEE